MKMAVGIILICIASGFNAGSHLPIEVLERINPSKASERYLSIGKLECQLDNDEAAIVSLTKAINANPNNGWAYCARAGALHRIGETEQAISDERKATSLKVRWLKLDQESDCESLIYRGLRKLQQRQPGAKSIFTRLIERQPRNAWFYYNRAQSSIFLGDKKSAAADLDEAIKLEAKNPWFLTSRAKLRETSEERVGAATDFFYAGRSWHDLGFDQQAAIKSFTRCIALLPNEPDPYGNRGVGLRMTGQTDAALKDFNKAIELEPDDPWNYCQRGRTLYEMGNWKEAIADYTTALKISPKFHLALQLKAFANFRHNKTERISDLTALIEHKDTNSKLKSTALATRGVAKIEGNKRRDGIKDLQMALKMNPADLWAREQFNQAMKL
jgi:tetratricopeptide (TPR) repeat protein